VKQREKISEAGLLRSFLVLRLASYLGYEKYFSTQVDTVWTLGFQTSGTNLDKIEDQEIRTK
jgi:hypothetical protein